MSLRLCERPHSFVLLLAAAYPAIPRARERSLDGPHRHACRSDARPVRGVEPPSQWTQVRGHPGSDHRLPEGPGGAIQGFARYPLQRPDDYSTGERDLPARRRRSGADEGRHATNWIERAGLSPDPQGGAHDFGSGRGGGDYDDGGGRGDTIPNFGSSVLAEVGRRSAPKPWQRRAEAIQYRSLDRRDWRR